MFYEVGYGIITVTNRDLDERDNMRKILLLGCSGSGKSTFAVKLHDATGLPLFHLDNVWWRPDRTHISRDEFDAKLEELLELDSWIIDGDYSRTYERRIAACDTIIFLDYGEEVCMEGIIGRIGRERRDIPWTENELDPELVDLVKKYELENKPLLLELFNQYPEKCVVALRSRADADRWFMKNCVIGSVVKGTVDRPLGSAHPDYPDMIYPVNYGYIEGVIAGDGQEQDAYILGTDKPIEMFEGKVIAIYHRFNDVEDKWIVSLDGSDYSDDVILQAIYFQEQYYEGELVR